MQSKYAKNLLMTWGTDQVFVGGIVAPWLVRLTLERAVWVQALAGDLTCCVLGQDTLLSRCPSPPRCLNEYW